MRYLTLTFLLAAAVSATAQPPSRTNIPKPPDNVIFDTDIVYRKGHSRWRLNVIRPRTDSGTPRAAIVLVHGGGWTTGDHYRFSYMGFKLAAQGYVVMLPTYRMIPDAPFPACLHDVRNSIRWLRAHARDHNVDPDRIGAYGNSAGATLALTVALTARGPELDDDGTYRNQSSALQAVVCSGAVGDMLHERHSRRAKTVYRNLAGRWSTGQPKSRSHPSCAPHLHPPISLPRRLRFCSFTARKTPWS